jgi:hypothetical protein
MISFGICHFMSVIETPPASSPLRSRIVRTGDIAWRDLNFLQNDDFKDLPESEKQKLKASLLANAFAQPFYVWHDTEADVMYCLDGKHRSLMLRELSEEGHEVPDMLPATFVECADKKEAAKMVLIYSSSYASVTQKGFMGFVSEFDLDLPSMMEQISISNLPEDFPEMPTIDELEGEGNGKPAVMKITFETAEDLEGATDHIDTFLKQNFPGAYFSVSCGEI